jgi:hypothetical protein
MATNGTGLARGAIGLREVLFQSVTSMAPAGAVALSIGQLAKHLPSAGSIYARSDPRLGTGHHRGRPAAAHQRSRLHCRRE